MQKILELVLVLALVFALTACGNQQKVQDISPKETVEASDKEVLKLEDYSNHPVSVGFDEESSSQAIDLSHTPLREKAESCMEMKRNLMF